MRKKNEFYKLLLPEKDSIIDNYVPAALKTPRKFL